MRALIGVSAVLAFAALIVNGCSGEDTEFPPGGAGGTTATGVGGDTGGGGTGGVGGGTGGGGPTCVDEDDDGVTDCDGDCDDSDPFTYPGATEVCGDGIANDCEGDPDPTAVCQGIGTFVSELTGDDSTGDGTQQNPVQTIAAGMTNAQTIGGGVDVFVAEGQYDEKITMVEGISLYGGHQCDTSSCTWQRDTATYDAIIINIDYEGVLFNDGITRATSFDGFVVNGRDGDPGSSGSNALTLDGGSPTVANNRINGGTVTGGGSGRFSVGVRMIAPSNDTAGALIHDNVIHAGTSSRVSNGMRMDSVIWPPPAPGAIAEIIGNDIAGGSAERSYGIAAWSTGVGTLIQDNDIAAGDSNNGASFGIVIGGTATIDANRVNTDQANVATCMNPGRWCGGIESESATLTLTNNVIYGIQAPRSAAVYLAEAELAVGEVVMNGNTLDGANVASSGGGNISTAIALRSTFLNSVNAFVGRIRNNILLGGAALNRFGIYEDDMPSPKTCKPELLENNDIFFVTQSSTTDNAQRVWDGNAGAMLATVTDVNVQSYAQSNFTGDPLLDATWHLGNGSPCIDAGASTEAPATDFEGDARPQGSGIDVGADEAI